MPSKCYKPELKADAITNANAIEEGVMSKIMLLPKRVVRFYVDGFKSMTIGKKLWAIIIIKLIVIFGVLKLFFFPDMLKSRYDTDAERAEAVRTALTVPRQ